MPITEPDQPPPELPRRVLPYVKVLADGVTATRIAFLTRSGYQWSYPYGYIGLIEMPHPRQNILRNTCGTMATTVIQGHNLSELTRLLDLLRPSSYRDR